MRATSCRPPASTEDTRVAVERSARIVGAKVRIDGVEFSVVGVAPERFAGMDPYVRPAFFVPLAVAPRLSSNPEDHLLDSRTDRRLSVRGRLAPGGGGGQH
jgi:hypothetical protein